MQRVEPRDEELARLGRGELVTAAMKDGKEGEPARWELARREHNKLVKKAQATVVKS